MEHRSDMTVLESRAPHLSAYGPDTHSTPICLGPTTHTHTRLHTYAHLSPRCHANIVMPRGKEGGGLVVSFAEPHSRDRSRGKRRLSFSPPPRPFPPLLHSLPLIYLFPLRWIMYQVEQQTPPVRKEQIHDRCHLKSAQHPV